MTAARMASIYSTSHTPASMEMFHVKHYERGCPVDENSARVSTPDKGNTGFNGSGRDRR